MQINRGIYRVKNIRGKNFNVHIFGIYAVGLGIFAISEGFSFQAIFYKWKDFFKYQCPYCL